ncbi:MAG: pyrroline-5-carboxylate reductase [Chloroflexi bacterium]|nr:pyrroline-5-carboxylate reductase [Chloroflexota bacterium]
MKLGFIGGGTMAEAIIAGVLKQRAAAAGDITASDIVAARRDFLSKTYSVKATDDNKQAIMGADLVVLAIKPQQLGEVLGGLRGSLKPSQAVLSIVAGATIESISTGLGHDLVIRAMPNTPGQIGAGITAWTATRQVGKAHREVARSVLAALGKEVYCADEKFIDIATALSGSGPAYVFLMIEALTDAGVYLGMPRETAAQLAIHTVVGSGTMALQSTEHPASLRNKVTSPGGTTAAALRVLDDQGLRTALINAVIAAYEKAVELGKKS